MPAQYGAADRVEREQHAATEPIDGPDQAVSMPELDMPDGLEGVPPEMSLQHARRQKAALHVPAVAMAMPFPALAAPAPVAAAVAMVRALQRFVARPVAGMIGLRRRGGGRRGEDGQDEHQGTEGEKTGRAEHEVYPSSGLLPSGPNVPAAERATASSPEPVRNAPFTLRSAVRELTRAMRIVLAALMLLAAVSVSPAESRAFSGNEQDSARKAVESGEIRSLKDILRGVRGRVDGQVLDTQLDETGRGYVYRVKVLGDDGRVRVLMIDARSGEVLQVLEGGG